MDKREESSEPRVRIIRSRTLGSGRMTVNPRKTLVHFGSPEGTRYSSESDTEGWLF